MMKLESPLPVSMGTPFLNHPVTVGLGLPIGGWQRSSAWLPSLICVEYGGVSKSFRRSEKINKPLLSNNFGVFDVIRIGGKVMKRLTQRCWTNRVGGSTIRDRARPKKGSPPLYKEPFSSEYGGTVECELLL